MQLAKLLDSLVKFRYTRLIVSISINIYKNIMIHLWIKSTFPFSPPYEYIVSIIIKPSEMIYIRNILVYNEEYHILKLTRIF